MQQRYSLSGETAKCWINGYKGEVFYPEKIPTDTSIVVIEGCEQMIYTLLQHHKERTRERWNELLRNWRLWEQGRNERNVILIGCDIGGGIVPMESEKRMWRDTVGWCYQDTASLADQVDEIWCGIAQTLKF